MGLRLSDKEGLSGRQTSAGKKLAMCEISWQNIFKIQAVSTFVPRHGWLCVGQQGVGCCQPANDNAR